MVVVSQVRVRPGAAKEEIYSAARALAGIPQSVVQAAYLVKTSVDARRRGRVMFVHSVGFTLTDRLEARYQDVPGCRVVTPAPYDPPTGDASLPEPPVVAGFGPAGMFCALLLAEKGYRPIVLERGGPVEERTRAVERFFQEGVLDENSNIQFGEGGAGTYSDGKLTTRIGDPRCDYVKRQLVRFGAPEEILVKAKPHIGTDLLRDVVRNIRKEILRLGGQILFDTRLTGLLVRDGVLYGVETNRAPLGCSQLVLAVGHSARDTFQMLYDAGVPFVQKPFSVGVRIEHLQQDVDRALYGPCAGDPFLPPAEYQYSLRQGEQAVYTFCMCPGGTVVAAASEQGGIVTNGMSSFARDLPNANSALVASVSGQDFGDGPFAGLAFQRRLEQSAFRLTGGWRAPCETVGSFLGTGKNAFGRVKPSYPIGVEPADLKTLFPARIADMLALGLRAFGRRHKGFDAPDALLQGPETRTSSPVRIPRGDGYECTQLAGLYPCGEGAGYAGGILSAAADGLRVAEQILMKYRPLD